MSSARSVDSYGKLCHLANLGMSKGLRKGQAYMNALAQIDLNLYRTITGTDDDPFYDDSKIPLFLIRYFEG